MKKMRGVALVALALAAVTLFCACGATAKSTEIGKLFDKNATYKSSELAPTKGEKVSDLSDKNMVDRAAMLTCFAKDGAYTVYNVDSAKTVLTVEKPDEGSVDVAVYALTLKDKDYGYALIVRTDKDGNKSTDLYDATGEKVATAAYEASAKTVADLLYFDGKCYRFSADSMLGEAFAYSVLNEMPNIVAYNEKYYLAKENYRYVVYDRLLLPVSSFDIPAYATINAQTMLPNGDILIQYRYELDDDAKKYDFLAEKPMLVDGPTDYNVKKLTKMDMVTLLVNPKNGKAKELKCDYLLMSARGVQMQDYENAGLKLGKIGVICTAVKIEDERIDTRLTMLVAIDKNGDVTAYNVNGERVLRVTMVATDRFVAVTDAHTYLLNGKGDVIGDISNGRIFGKYVLCDNKVYDLSLKLVTDLDEGDFTVSYVMNKALLLRNVNGDIAMYTENGDIVTLAGEKSEASLYSTQDEYVVIVREGNYVVVAQNGNEILTVKDEGQMQRVYVGENAIIVSVPEYVNNEYRLVYYRLAA